MNKGRLEVRDGSRRCPSCVFEKQQCPRCEAYERLPKWRPLQSLITFVMGVPHDGEMPLMKQTPTLRLAVVFGVFLASVAATGVLTALLASVGWAGRIALAPLLLTTILTASGMFRSMSMYVLHYASHDAYEGRYNSLVGNAASLLALSLSLEEYAEKHKRKHHGRLDEREDPDRQTIIALGFVPGMSYAYYRKHLLEVLVSPRYFRMHLRGRLASQFAATRSFSLKALAVALHAGLLVVALAAAYASASFMPVLVWAVAWLLPLTYGTYASMVLFALGLHRWFLQPEPGKTKADYFAKTSARFFGDPAPPSGLSTAKRWRVWGIWWLRFFVLHLLLGKLFIMGLSDNQQHDAHHIDPTSEKFFWWESTHSRHRLASESRYAAKMTNTWGSLFAAIHANFERMARTPSLAPDEVAPEVMRDNDFLNGM